VNEISGMGSRRECNILLWIHRTRHTCHVALHTYGLSYILSLVRSNQKSRPEQMRVVAVTISALILFFPIALATARNETSAAIHWQALTKIDVEAAYELLKDNHPAAVPQVGDRAFQAALAEAHEKAFRHASMVTNYQGYVAAMGEFANSMGDGHIWSIAQFLPRTVQWPGIIAAKRGPNWVVASEETNIAGAQLVGARIVSCDGQSTEALALKALRFHTVVSSDAMQVLQGLWLFIDDGNPFLTRPHACNFEQKGRNISLTLNWNNISFTTLVRQYWKRPSGQAGFGVRPVGPSFWMAFQSLTPEAQPVIDAVKKHETEIRSAPYVVVDLRGNGGGDDSYGRALAEELYGPDYVASILGLKDSQTGGCDEVFRASSGNIAAIGEAAQQFQKDGDTEGFKEYTKALRAMKAAVATGQPLAGDLTCRTKIPAASAQPQSLMRGKVFLLTDAACFSSCIDMVIFFRKLGAIQVGQTTGADTHYSEVRQILLPSGLSTFSTLQAIMPDQPRNIGPFVPKFQFDGDIADTAALEKWIAEKANSPSP
jgi:hypothetical protein